MRVLSDVARISFPTAMYLMIVFGWYGNIFFDIQAWAPGSFASEGISPLPTVTVTEILVPAKAFRMVGFVSNILMRSMFVLVLRKFATFVGVGRLSAMVP